MNSSSPSHRALGRGGIRCWLSALFLSLFAVAASAEEQDLALTAEYPGPNLITDTFMATLGLFILDSETTVRLDGAAGEVGTDFDWEENFGDSDGSRFRVDGAWRFRRPTQGPRHVVQFLAESIDGIQRGGRLG